jgi:type III secretory pathway component EscS
MNFDLLVLFPDILILPFSIVSDNLLATIVGIMISFLQSGEET